MSLLLVCNEPSFRVVLGDLLREQGYEVDVCRDLDGAKRQLQRTSYDLVILNLLDAGDAALHACRELRSISPRQKMAFIRGRWTEIPAPACPDYLIALPESPRKLLEALSEILARDSRQPPAYTWELSGSRWGL
jgi:CheY-like chemotaxis protein